MEKEKILIIGSSSDLAQELNKYYVEKGAMVGLHYGKNNVSVRAYQDKKNVLLIPQFFDNSAIEEQADNVVKQYVEWAGGIDYLVILIGDIKEVKDWRQITCKNWYDDLNTNAIVPFFIAQKVAFYMEKQKKGRIIFTSTSSAIHGGGTTTVTYGASKALLESFMKRMAKDLAKSNVLVNAIAPGVIDTKFHTERMGRNMEQMNERIQSIPLKRIGKVREVTSVVKYLLSKDATFITGQTINVDGGDWI